MTEQADRRSRRGRARTRLLLPLLLATCLGAAAPSHADSQNVVRYIRPVSYQGVVSYDVCLYSSVEFPMRDEVATLTIGAKGFINSSYVQGGDLHTIIFSLTPDQFRSLKNGDPIIVYYGQSDASNPAAQWVFGTFQGVTVTAVGAKPIGVIGTPITATPIQDFSAKAARKSSPMPAQTAKSLTTTKKGKK